jgi:hypothetical protein
MTKPPQQTNHYHNHTEQLPSLRLVIGTNQFMQIELSSQAETIDKAAKGIEFLLQKYKELDNMKHGN